MTARCNGGTSSQLPGTGASNVIGAGLITAGLELLSPWLLPVALLVDAFVYEANSQCTSDPPPMPVFDSSDMQILALGLLAPNAQQTLDKIHNLLLNYAWDKFCQCDQGGFQPSAPVPPPAGTTGVSGKQSTPCFQGALNTFPPFQAAGSPVAQQPDFTLQMLGSDGRTRTSTFPDGSTGISYGMPAGTTTVSFTGSFPITTGLGCSAGRIGAVIYFHDSTGVSLGGRDMGIPTGVNCNAGGSVTVPANSSFWNAKTYRQNQNEGTLTTPLVYQTNVWCGGGGPGVLQNCCPPDPALSLAVGNILSLIEQLLSLQQLGGPYSDTIRHSSLSGAGTITINPASSGIRVEVKSDLTNWPHNPQVPNYYYSLGFITPFAVGTPLRGQRIIYNKQTFTWPSYTDQIGFTFEPGVTADIVELTRGN